MTSARIDFKTDAATFNKLRDEWRSVAAGCALSKAGFRVAGVLPTFVNREHGFAFPSDEAIAEAIGADKKTAKRGLISLGEFHLIDRDTGIRKNEKGIIVGKQRRIFLTLPAGQIEALPKEHSDDQPKGHFEFEPKGHSPKGQAEPKGQKTLTEGTPVCPYILDSTLDNNSALETNVREGTYPRDVPSAGTVPSVEEKKRILKLSLR
ncbi:hypothetical protein [Rhizobium sp. Leaf386]|uniref:hypothetical protein n=1 Tax=Rhizobium sp. Leaf386 TaxID=1736359 RepID=UPI0007128221|nr:hypothetical protein [Rhizobium sp. Leaf386]KQT04137.1 hypothetical protein ASG50_18230 [Rhizobium sp. Leaf386]